MEQDNNNDYETTTMAIIKRRKKRSTNNFIKHVFPLIFYLMLTTVLWIFALTTGIPTVL